MAEDLYGLGASGIPPELAAEMMGIKGRKAIAQALMEQSMQPLQAPEVKGRFSVPISPLQGMAKLAQSYLGQKGLSESDKAMAGVGQKYQTGVADALAKYEQTKRGIPGQMVPQVGEMGESYPAMEQGGVKGDPRKAVMDALNSSYISRNPLVTADLKEMYEDKSRKIISGEEEIYQERQPDGSWKEVGRGPRFAKQVPSVTIGGGNPFFTPVQTAEGVYSFDARKGEMKKIDVGGKSIVGSSSDPTLQGDIAGAKAVGKTKGEDVTKHQITLPQVEHNADYLIDLVKRAKDHPGMSQVIGLPNIITAGGRIPGTKGADFRTFLDQIKGKTFLSAYETLKGGGQITEIEGQKATDAFARMGEAQTEKSFKEAANEFISEITKLKEIAQKRAGGKSLSGDIEGSEWSDL